MDTENLSPDPIPQTSQPDTRPGWLVNLQAEGTEVSVMEIDGIQYPYTLVQDGLAPGLPYVVSNEHENALFISVGVPEKYRPFILAHEVREQVRFQEIPEAGRCLASLKAELADVLQQTPDIYAEYVIGRRAFFEALNTFYEDPQQKAARTPDFIEGLTRSRDYLNSLDIIPSGTFDSDYTPDQVAAIRKAIEIGEKLVKKV